MSDINHNQNTLDPESLLNVALTDVPDSKALQARILDVTRDMPQQASQEDALPANVSVMPRLIKRVMPLAVAASVALFAVLAFPGLFNTGSDSMTDQEFAAQMSIDEIEFQEAMLLHDEWLFAQL